MGKFLQKFYLIIMAVIAGVTAVFCAVRNHNSEKEAKKLSQTPAVSTSADNVKETSSGHDDVVFAEESVQEAESPEEPAESEKVYELIDIASLSVPGFYSYSFDDANVNDNDSFTCFCVPVNPGEKYHLIAAVYGWACLYKITDADDNVIAVFDPDERPESVSAGFDEIISVPDNGARLLVSYENNSFSVLEKIQSAGSASDGLISASASSGTRTQCDYSYALSKTLCIGDSLTSGAYFKQPLPGKLEAGDSITQSYPYYLKRINRMDTVTNAGVSGITVNGWLVSEFKKHDMKDYDSFIIWLGTNGGLSGSLETDVNPFSKYADYANTGVGNYCTIIEKIREENPDSFIVLCTVFTTESGTDAETTNRNIKAIGEKYDIRVIDMSDLAFSQHPELHGNFNNIHFTKSGNIFVASRILSEINSIFTEDPSLTEFGISKRKK